MHQRDSDPVSPLPEKASTPKTPTVGCGHKGCIKRAVGVVGVADRGNPLHQTHDCCGGHRGCKRLLTPLSSPRPAS